MWKLQIFIDSFALLTHGRGSFEELKTENKTKIDWLVAELRASVYALRERDARRDHERHFYKFVVACESSKYLSIHLPFKHMAEAVLKSWKPKTKRKSID